MAFKLTYSNCSDRIQFDWSTTIKAPLWLSLPNMTCGRTASGFLLHSEGGHTISKNIFRHFYKSQETSRLNAQLVLVQIWFSPLREAAKMTMHDKYSILDSNNSKCMFVSILFCDVLLKAYKSGRVDQNEEMFLLRIFISLPYSLFFVWYIDTQLISDIVSGVRK